MLFLFLALILEAALVCLISAFQLFESLAISCVIREKRVELLVPLLYNPFLAPPAAATVVSLVDATEQRQVVLNLLRFGPAFRCRGSHPSDKIEQRLWPNGLLPGEPESVWRVCQCEFRQPRDVRPQEFLPPCQLLCPILIRVVSQNRIQVIDPAIV